jgi:acetyl esterase/lipase
MTWVACSFLVFACFCVGNLVISSLSLRRPVPVLIIPIFVIGILSTEFAWFFLGLQVLISLVFIAMGVLAETAGSVALGLMVISWLGLWRMHRQAHAADEVLRSALQRGLGEDFRGKIPEQRQSVLRDHIVAREWLRPFSMMRPGVERLEDIAYGDAGERNLLDIYRPRESRDGGFPVLLQVHGGGWFSGHKQ